MRRDKSADIVRKFKSEIRSIKRFAIREQYHFDRILDRIKARVYDHKDYKRLPQWGRAEIRGYVDAVWDSIQDEYTEWHVRFEGQLIDGDDVPEGRWNEVEPGAQVWIESGAIFSDSQDYA